MNHHRRVQTIVCMLSIVHLLLGNPLFANHRRKNKPIHPQTPCIQKTVPPIIDELMNNHLPEVVVNTKLLKFNENPTNAYNASIIEQDGGYLLIFRHDTKKQVCDKCKYLLPEIKMVYLDNNFDQISSIKTLLLSAHYPEDARVHIFNKKLFLTYNDEPEAHAHHKIRRLSLGELDANIGTVSNIKILTSQDQILAPVEKNWIPFEYPENTGSLYYTYATSPYTIMKVDDINNGITTTIPTINTNYIDCIWLKEKWGGIRGGTPARLVDGVYLSFFHSWVYIRSHKSAYYFMGAYIFQAEPPFKILAITPNPISFTGMYSARHRVSCLHVTYPAGFAIEKKDDKCLLHVSCGENDTSIRIISIDKDALLKSMVRVP